MRCRITLQELWWDFKKEISQPMMCHLLISCNFFILPNAEAAWYLLATKPCKVKHLNHINTGDLSLSFSNLRSSANNFSGYRCYYRNQHFKTTQPCAKPPESGEHPMSLTHFNFTFTLCTCTGGFNQNIVCIS